MALFGNKNKVTITAKSVAMNVFLRDVNRFVQEYDKGIYASEEERRDLTNQSSRVGFSRRGNYVTKVDMDFRYDQRTAQYLDAFYSELAKLVERYSKNNHEKL